MTPRTRETDATTEPIATARLEGEVARIAGLTGRVFAGKYELIREIGRGGMGTVWQAERLDWKAPVAVKLMARSLQDTAIARERFEREVRLAATLRGQHVVQVLDHGVDEATQTPFIVMELLQGESLSGRIRRLRVLSPSEVMTVVTHLGRALTRAHQAGIVHRDLKPDNIYLVQNEDEPIVAKVLDFGVAKSFEIVQIDSRAVTAEGHVVGTPWYMSPEQLRGAGPLDHRSDLWSVAVIACECLTGKRPFHATDLATLTVMLLGDGPRPVPSRLGRVPPGFDEWFARATARDLQQRFQSARELVDALLRVCGSSRTEQMPPLVYEKHGLSVRAPSTAPMSSTSNATPSPLFRRPKLVVSLCAAAAVGLVANYYMFFIHGYPTRAPDGVASSASLPTPAEPTSPVPLPRAPEQHREAEAAIATPPAAATEPSAPESPPPVIAEPRVAIGSAQNGQGAARPAKKIRPPVRQSHRPTQPTAPAADEVDDQILREEL